RSVENIEPFAPVLAQLKRIQRVLHVAQEPGVVTALMGEGFHSAFEIARIPVEIFVPQSGLGSDEQAKAVYASASSISAAIATIAFNVKLRADGPLPGAIGPWPPPALSPSGDGPNLDTLFGPADYCKCVDCLSVLSPSAYLVDILHNF